MRSVLVSSILCLSLLSGSLAMAQQPAAPQAQVAPAKTKAEAKTKNKYRADDFGDLHDKAKKHGIDTSNPESLKGRDIGGEIAKSVKL